MVASFAPVRTESNGTIEKRLLLSSGKRVDVRSVLTDGFFWMEVHGSDCAFVARKLGEVVRIHFSLLTE